MAFLSLINSDVSSQLTKINHNCNGQKTVLTLTFMIAMVSHSVYSCGQLPHSVLVPPSPCRSCVPGTCTSTAWCRSSVSSFPSSSVTWTTEADRSSEDSGPFCHLLLSLPTSSWQSMNLAHWTAPTPEVWSQHTPRPSQLPCTAHCSDRYSMHVRTCVCAYVHV